MLEVRGASITVQGMPVVRDVSLKIGPSEIVGLVGSNGAGKTSLARAIVGLTKLDSGSLHFREAKSWARVDSLDPWTIALRGIVYVPEERGAFEGLTVDENLLVAFTTTSMPAARASLLLKGVYKDFPFLERRLHQKAGTLSGGEKKMLSIARAVLFTKTRLGMRPNDRRLLILDEPTHGLHQSARDLVAQVIRDLRERGISVLILEQEFGFALEVAERCWRMENGEIVGELR